MANTFIHATSVSILLAILIAALVYALTLR
jgi:hypothetical protein